MQQLFHKIPNQLMKAIMNTIITEGKCPNLIALIYQRESKFNDGEMLEIFPTLVNTPRIYL